MDLLFMKKTQFFSKNTMAINPCKLMELKLNYSCARESKLMKNNQMTLNARPNASNFAV